MKYSLYCLSLASVALTQSLAPSPTESMGCEAHENHWHCDGPVSTTSTGTNTFLTTTATATSSEGDKDHDHDHESGTGSIAPSPTESVGCEPHGDHWHCNGPASITVTSNATSSSGASVTSSTIATTPSTAGAPKVALGGALLFAGFVFGVSM